jgi:LysM domain
VTRTTPATRKVPPGAAGAALAGTRDASGQPAIRGSGGHRRQRHRTRRRLRAVRPGQHRAAGAAVPGRRLRAAADAAGAVVLLAGLPWALARLAGPPLPGHWPGWQQVREALSSPPVGGTAITVLAGAAWLLWAVFAAAVIAEVTAAACGRPVPRLPAIAPVQALAATLAGTAVLTALHLPRTTARAAQPSHAVLTATVTAAAPVLPGSSGSGGRPRTSRAAGTSGAARPEYRVHAVVAGDNLWDLARAYLGSGNRWHQIYALNRGRPQPGGGTLTDPARIYPGWDLLIPAAGPHPRGNPPSGQPARRRPPAPAAAGSPGPARSPHPARSTPAAAQPGAGQHAGPAGVRLPSGALIGLGTAVAVSAAVALARMRRRRRYRPGTVLTSSLEPPAPPTPVIAALRRAARVPGAGTAPAAGTSPDDAEPDPDLDEPDERPFPGSREAGRAAPPAARLISRPPPGPQATAPPGLVPIGIRDGQEITADPAALGGLGLTGPGALAAARAILAGLLTRPPRSRDGTPAQVIIPAADAARLLPAPAGHRARPPVRGVLVPPALGAALDEAEAMIVRRARTADGGDGPQTVAVVLAVPGPAAAQRLAGITAAGRDLGIAVILLGDWPHGTTCHITADSLISAVTPPQAGLAGTEAYHLPAADLAAIIAQLGHATHLARSRHRAADPPGPARARRDHPAVLPGPAQRLPVRGRLQPRHPGRRDHRRDRSRTQPALTGSTRDRTRPATGQRRTREGRR